MSMLGAAAGGAAAVYGAKKIVQAGNNLGIGDLSIGVSVSGAYDYLDGINSKAINHAIEALNNTDSVTKEFQAGWQGKAEANFENNLYRATDVVTKELELIKENIESLVSEMIEDWANQDEKLVEETDVIAF